MKKIATIILLLFIHTNYSQTKSENKLITKIEKIILSPKVNKLESFQKLDWAGGYEKTNVYIKNNFPILIVKELKEVIHYRTNKGEYDNIRLITAKFYITNWKKQTFIRIGQIVNMNKNSKDTIFEMPNEYKFDYSKDDIDKLIKK